MLEHNAFGSQCINGLADIGNREIENRECGWSVILLAIRKNACSTGDFQFQADVVLLYVQTERVAVEFSGASTLSIENPENALVSRNMMDSLSDCVRRILCKS